MTDLPRIGIDLGGSKILAAVVSPDGRVLGRCKVKTQAANGGYDGVRQRLVTAAEAACQAAGTTPAVTAGCGIGVPGTHDGQIVRQAANLGWHDAPTGAGYVGRIGRYSGATWQ